MSGLFGCLAHTTQECMRMVFYGTDYHCHLASEVAGVAFCQDRGGFMREIHSLRDGAQFKHVFGADFSQMLNDCQMRNLNINLGLGVISDRDPQPLIYSSKFGDVAIATVGRVPNLHELADELKTKHLLSLRENGKINIAEVILRLVEDKKDLVEGIQYMWSRITGSISMVMIFADGRMIGVRDRYGVSSLALGRAENGIRAFASETSSFFNLGFTEFRFLKPGEIVQISKIEEKTLQLGCQQNCRVCAFNWIYSGSPAASYEDVNVEPVRYACGAALAKKDWVKPDSVAGIPDSGTSHAIGYSNETGIPFTRPLIKSPTYNRSYIPEDPAFRQLVATMKILPVLPLISGKRLLFCDDSIVRGNQLSQRAEILHQAGAEEIHFRIACPPLLFPCPYLRAVRKYEELIARQIIAKIQKRIIDEKTEGTIDISPFLDHLSQEYALMLKEMRVEIKATTLVFQRLDDMIEAIGLPKDQLCTFCWTGITIF